MKVSANINKTDLICSNYSLWSKLKSTYITILLLSVGVSLYILWKDGLPNGIEDLATVIISALLSGTGGFLTYTLICIISILFTSKEKNGILGQRKYAITPEGLYVKTIANEGIQKWEGVTYVRKTNSYIYLQVTCYLFYIIPKRSFDTPDDFQRFFNASLQYYREAHNYQSSVLSQIRHSQN